MRPTRSVVQIVGTYYLVLDSVLVKFNYLVLIFTLKNIEVFNCELFLL